MRKLKIIKFLLIMFVIIFLASCSSKIVTNSKLGNDKIEPTEIDEKLELKIIKIDSWVNAMPGTEKPKFHISGEIEIEKSNKFNLNKLVLKSIHIFQNDKIIFYISPTQNENQISTDKMKRLVKFTTLKGLRLNPSFDSNKPIKVQLIFSDNINTYDYIKDNVEVEKAF